MKRTEILALLVFVAGFVLCQMAVADSESFRPVGWEEIVADGMLGNPQMAYDGEFDDTTTKCDVDSGYDRESVAFFFEPGAFLAECNLVYAWTTSGCGHGVELPAAI